MGFITSLITDALFITTGAGALRRFTGLSISQFVVPYIKNEGVRGAAVAYFKIGDFIVDTTADFFKKKGIEYDDKNRNNNDNNKRFP